MKDQSDGVQSWPERGERNGLTRSPIAGLDGLLCPVCGEIADSLPIKVQRVIQGTEECLFVCSPDCRQIALESPFLQINMFSRDLRVWERSVQSELDIESSPVAEASETEHNGREHS